jgi:type IV pilus assembly protein PilX
MPRFEDRIMRRTYGGRGRERGIIMFMALVLLLVLTILAVSLARTQTIEERLAQNDNNHQLALQTAEATLQAAFDDDVAGIYTDFSGGTVGLNTLYNEILTTGTTLGYSSSTWTAANSIAYNGAALASAPAAANPKFVIENMAPVVPPGCNSGNAGNYGASQVTVHRITAQSAGGDGSASATVQALHIGSC